MKLNVLFRDIVNLEKENYGNEARRFCQYYDERFSLNRLIKEHSDERLIVYCYKDETLVAFITFNQINIKLSIMSLQLKKGYECYLGKLIKNTYEKLQSVDFELVEGQAYKDNLLALSLHRKLGLHHSQDLGDRLGFITTKTKFLESLGKHIKKSDLPSS